MRRTPATEVSVFVSVVHSSAANARALAAAWLSPPDNERGRPTTISTASCSAASVGDPLEVAGTAPNRLDRALPGPPQDRRRQRRCGHRRRRRRGARQVASRSAGRRSGGHVVRRWRVRPPRPPPRSCVGSTPPPCATSSLPPPLPPSAVAAARTRSPALSRHSCARSLSATTTLGLPSADADDSDRRRPIGGQPAADVEGQPCARRRRRRLRRCGRRTRRRRRRGRRRPARWRAPCSDALRIRSISRLGGAQPLDEVVDATGKVLWRAP